MTEHLTRPVDEGDLEAIVVIYNDVIQTSFTIWQEEPGRMPEVGQIRGSWRHLVLLQKILTT